MARPLLGALVVLTGITPLVGTAAPTRTLTFEDRARAQEAIDPKLSFIFEAIWDEKRVTSAPARITR